MTWKKSHSLFLVCAFGLAAVVAVLLWRMQARVDQPLDDVVPYSELQEKSLLKISGVPQDMTIEGEVTVDGTLHPLSLLAAMPGQRVFGVENLESVPQENYRIALRLIGANGNKIRDIAFGVSGSGAPYEIGISLDGFSADSAASVSLNGVLTMPATPLDWNGRMTTKQEADKTDIIQISILPNEFETYVITAGNFLRYYLEDFENPGQTLNGLAPFSFGDETTTAESNRLAKSLQSGEGRAIGWWANDAQTVLIARMLNNDCNSACRTTLFIKDADEWREAFSEGVDILWLDRDTIGQPGSEFYTVAGNNPTNRWVLQDGRYVLYDAQEGGAS